MAENFPSDPSSSNQDIVEKALRENFELYDGYYRKPWWWFRLRYDTQVKRKTVLHLYRQTGKPVKHLRILEIGFGSGEVLFSFPNDCELYGVEISPSAIEVARQRAKQKNYARYEFSLSETEELAFEEGSFDLVVASHVIEHVPDDAKFLKEVRRVLRQDGVAIILIPINEEFDDPRHLHRYTAVGFLKLIEEHGFKSPFHLENELLYNLVRKFYLEDKDRMGLMGKLIAGCFNVPTALLPFPILTWLDRLLFRMGYLPSQFGLVLQKS